jgi:hypothetical protein
MKAFNVVRFRVKPGEDERFLDAHREMRAEFDGYRGGALIKTGEHAYCFIGGWDDFDSLAAARPQMIALLDSVRDLLEDLGGGLGVTDPVSGETVVELPAQRKPAKKRAAKRARPANSDEGSPDSTSSA